MTSMVKKRAVGLALFVTSKPNYLSQHQSCQKYVYKGVLCVLQ
jgi:hypothetical protein